MSQSLKLTPLTFLKFEKSSVMITCFKIQDYRQLHMDTKGEIHNICVKKMHSF